MIELREHKGETAEKHLTSVNLFPGGDSLSLIAEIARSNS